ncbi:phage capsid protein [Azospirillum sp.]|uniref:phage capsid protein n=1 Tax=Azospirillum sp. TaxID=34012 RepID=UPI00262C2626|nr:phage capsid protein [Azospirillum sp.]
MSAQIPAHFQNAYQKNLELGLQQKGSRLETCVRTESQTAERDFYDRIGPTEAQDVTQRHGDTKYANTDHIRRACTIIPAVWADLIDKWDKIQLVTDPTSAYTQNAIHALNRRKDRHILTAALGTAYSGKEGTTPVTLPASQLVAVNYVESGGAVNSGMTIGKLRRAAAILGLADNDEDEDTYLALTENQVQDLLKTTEVTSEDFNSVKALVAGKIDTFMGFKFKKLSPGLVAKASTTRKCVAWKKSGIVLAKGMEVQSKVTELPTKNYSVQVWCSGMFGAARLDEQKVVEIDCLEN